MQPALSPSLRASLRVPPPRAAASGVAAPHGYGLLQQHRLSTSPLSRSTAILLCTIPMTPSPHPPCAWLSTRSPDAHGGARAAPASRALLSSCPAPCPAPEPMRLLHTQTHPKICSTQDSSGCGSAEPGALVASAHTQAASQAGCSLGRHCGGAPTSHCSARVALRRERRLRRQQGRRRHQGRCHLGRPGPLPHGSAHHAAAGLASALGAGARAILARAPAVLLCVCANRRRQAGKVSDAGGLQGAMYVHGGRLREGQIIGLHPAGGGGGRWHGRVGWWSSRNTGTALLPAALQAAGPKPTGSSAPARHQRLARVGVLRRTAAL